MKSLIIGKREGYPHVDSVWFNDHAIISIKHTIHINNNRSIKNSLNLSDTWIRFFDNI